MSNEQQINKAKHIVPTSGTPENYVLEQFIDNNGLSDTLDDLADICLAKELHLLENWQDKQSARAWRKAFYRVRRAFNEVEKLGL